MILYCLHQLHTEALSAIAPVNNLCSDHQPIMKQQMCPLEGLHRLDFHNNCIPASQVVLKGPLGDLPMDTYGSTRIAIFPFDKIRRNIKISATKLLPALQELKQSKSKTITRFTTLLEEFTLLKSDVSTYGE
nr:hypothetical protein Iba_chr01bCG4440 [Ipomoea batatas]